MYTCYILYVVAPRELSISGNSGAEELGTVSLHCTVSANPRPDIVWLKRSTGGLIHVVNSSRISFSIDYDSENRVGVSTLTVSSVTGHDGGEYVCKASNGLLTTSPVALEWDVAVTGE